MPTPNARSSTEVRSASLSAASCGRLTNTSVVAEFGRRAEAAWGVLNTHLAGRKYVVGERLTVVDLSLCGYLFWPEEIGVDWNSYPNIRDWLARIQSEPRWVHPYKLMPGHPRPQAA